MDPDLPRPAPPRSIAEQLREWVVLFGAGRLVATAVAVVAVVLGGAWLLQGSPSRAEDQLPFAGRTTTSGVSTTVEPSTTSTSSTVVVYVTGAVTVPGVYTLVAPARVTDAVAAARGATAVADLDVVNLAATLHDGERIYVPEVGELVPPVVSGDTVVDTSAPAGPVDVNTATVDQLDVLPGVGPTTAAAIVAYRDQHGPFQTVDQLGEVRGIGPSKLDAIRGLVVV